MIDKQAILAILKEYFIIKGRVTVDDQGLVMVTGDCKLRESETVTQLPVQFASVGEGFCYYSSRLTSLKGSPQSVGEYFYCYSNQLTSLVGAPQSFGGDFTCYDNQLTSLKGLPKSINGVFYLDYIPNLPMLRLFKVHGTTEVFVRDPTTDISGHPVRHIINRYLHLGINGILLRAAELYKAGYGGNANL